MCLLNIWLGRIICGDNVEVLSAFDESVIDLVVTSPPYDGLRKYGNYSFNFAGVASQLVRVLKPGGVIVWVVADSTVKGSETLTSMRQAIHFKDVCGLNVHDTMIYHRHSAPSVAVMQKRYEQHWEYMFVFSKGEPNTCNHLRETKTYMDARVTFRGHRKTDGKHSSRPNRTCCVNDTKIKGNVWKYNQGGGHNTSDRIAHHHPAIFPEALAMDHILTWSNPGDVVLDPFAGSGTTCKVAKLLNRQWCGIEINHDYCEIAEARLSQGIIPLDNSPLTHCLTPFNSLT